MPDPNYSIDPDEKCPVCGSVVERGDWWDDPRESGGALIGSLLRCTSCLWDDQR